MNYLLRRRGLGGNSCPAIAGVMQSNCKSTTDPALPEASDVVFRWGCTASVEPVCPNIINRADAISFGADKKRSRLALQEAGVFVPESWDNIDTCTPRDYVIVRPSTHSQGNNLHYCTTAGQLRAAVAACGPDYYISKYIPKVREYRVYVVCGRIVAVADKLPDDPTAIAWNHAQGSSYKNVKWGSWPLAGCYEAVKAMSIIGLDFAGVDVIEDKEGNAYVLELNSAPSLFSTYRTQCMAKAFDYIVDHGKAVIPLGTKEGWRSFVHPALSGEAV